MSVWNLSMNNLDYKLFCFLSKTLHRVYTYTGIYIYQSNSFVSSWRYLLIIVLLQQPLTPLHLSVCPPNLVFPFISNLHTHISKASNFLVSPFRRVHDTSPCNATFQTTELIDAYRGIQMLDLRIAIHLQVSPFLHDSEYDGK